MVAFLRNESNVDVACFSINRARREARERNPNRRDGYMHEISFLRSKQLVFTDKTGVDRSIGTKRSHRGPRFPILPPIRRWCYAFPGI